ncbi:ABC transporter permease subunit [Chenggangzhangella methanolivorans]|uniref:ABC transporter permease subunit n=1 Tax=Chenggangzhangella methanolivorans TaxID=1437009 RepID=A0A9E6UK53_9HYPH|nr:ABC transporter permease subunit [Chenggangzhangella methanolivorans]QZN98846.1 ABC transporter permease subunit [Chenggangzhangella methanolivorans]
MSLAEDRASVPVAGSSAAPRRRPAKAPAGGPSKRASRQALAALSWAAPVAFLIVWETLCRSGYVAPQILPAPSKVALTAWKLATTGSLFHDLGVSLLRAATGFTIGGALGFALGVAVGFSRVAEAAIDRSVQMVRAVPFLAALPLTIIWFGVGETQKIFLVSLGVLFPIYVNTVLGIRQVDPKLLELARVQGLSAWTTIARVILPGALPSVLTGVRYALAVAWLALVVAETVGAQAGLGFLAMDAREFLRTDVIVLTIVIYAAIGAGSDAIARLLERRLLRWHPNYAEGAR